MTGLMIRDRRRAAQRVLMEVRAQEDQAMLKSRRSVRPTEMMVDVGQWTIRPPTRRGPGLSSRTSAEGQLQTADGYRWTMQDARVDEVLGMKSSPEGLTLSVPPRNRYLARLYWALAGLATTTIEQEHRQTAADPLQARSVGRHRALPHQDRKS